MATNDDVTTDESGTITGGWSEEIPDDISLFAEESSGDPPAEPAVPEPAEPPPAEDPKEDPPAAPPVETPPKEDAKPAETPPKEEVPKEDPPPSLKQMMADIEERDRSVGERERNLRDADKWRQQAEEHTRFMEDLRRDPLAALQRAGADVTRAFEEKLGIADEQTPEQKLEARLEAIEKERADERQRATQHHSDSRMAAAQQNVQRRHLDFVASQAEIPLESNPHAHLASFKQQAAQTMWARFEDYATRTGRGLPDAEAARQAEEQLRDEVEMVLDIASKMPQYQGRFRNGEGQQAAPAETRGTPPGKTTSNKDTTTPPPAVRKDTSLVGASDDEVLAAGLAAYAETTRR